MSSVRSKGLQAAVIALAASVTVGCGKTNATWVAAPESAPFATSASTEQAEGYEPSTRALSSLEESSAPVAAPRLRHTISLGAVDDFSVHSRGMLGGYGQAHYRGGYAPYGPPPVVYYPMVPAYGAYRGASYGGVGYGAVTDRGVAAGSSRSSWSTPTFGPGSPSSSPGSAPSLGGDWPRAASHGPAFPYQSAPGSPWRGGR